MNPKWAEENLQTIRTLMERSAIYRRALAPIMIYVGSVGIIGGIIGWQIKISSLPSFILLWVIVAVVSLSGALAFVRRQAIKDSEPFWSPPMHRVGQALQPAFAVGLALSGVVMFVPQANATYYLMPKALIIAWSWCYGCGLHAAGFFTTQSVRQLGWAFIFVGCFSVNVDTGFSSNLLMGAIFGGLHLAYGIYLYFTEKKTPVA